MKVKFNTFEKVGQFIRLTTSMESDVFVKSGKYVVDGKSVMGLYSLDLSKELDVEVIEKREGEIERLKNELSKLDILS